MIHRKSYRIENWKRWDDELNAAVQDFHVRFSIFPCIMLASEVTYSRLSLVANKKNVENDEGRHPDEAEYASLTAFRGNGYELDFCIDENISCPEFALIYDSDPSGGGEPVPDEDTDIDEEILGQIRKVG